MTTIVARDMGMGRSNRIIGGGTSVRYASYNDDDNNKYHYSGGMNSNNLKEEDDRNGGRLSIIGGATNRPRASKATTTATTTSTTTTTTSTTPNYDGDTMDFDRCMEDALVTSEVFCLPADYRKDRLPTGTQ